MPQIKVFPTSLICIRKERSKDGKTGKKRNLHLTYWIKITYLFPCDTVNSLKTESETYSPPYPLVSGTHLQLTSSELD